MIIDVDVLQEQLDLMNVDYSDYDTSQLELLLRNTINELIGYTQLPILPQTHKRILRKFRGDFLELDFYPVSNITTFCIGSKTVPDEKYVLDETLGIIYLNNEWYGNLEIEYTCELPESVIDTTVNSLLLDMIRYKLDTGFSKDGDWSSVKEGDVQVNYNVATSLGSLIFDRINRLKSMYNIRLRVI